MELLVDNDDYRISYYPELECTYLDYLRKPGPGRFRAACEDLIKAFASTPARRHMTNTSLMGVVAMDDQKFVSTHLVPKLKESVTGDHALCIGLILGPDVFASFGAKNMAKKAEQVSQEVKTNFFSHQTEAMAWFRELDEKAALRA